MNRRRDCPTGLPPVVFCIFQPLVSGQLCLVTRVSAYGKFLDCMLLFIVVFVVFQSA